MIRIVPTQRNPGHSSAPDSNRHAKLGRRPPMPPAPEHTPDEPLQVPEPIPSARQLHPAAIVERSKSPRRIIHPGPSPRLHPGPVTFAIRSPARMHVRIPDRTIHRRRLPVPIAVQILVADRPGGNISRRGRRNFLPSPAPRTTVECIRPGIDRNWCIASDCPLLKLEALAAAGTIHRAVLSPLASPSPRRT